MSLTGKWLQLWEMNSNRMIIHLILMQTIMATMLLSLTMKSKVKWTDAIKLDQYPSPAIKSRKTRSTPLQNVQSIEAQELIIQKLQRN